jgi:hypothetical protein
MKYHKYTYIGWYYTVIKITNTIVFNFNFYKNLRK